MKYISVIIILIIITSCKSSNRFSTYHKVCYFPVEQFKNKTVEREYYCKEKPEKTQFWQLKYSENDSILHTTKLDSQRNIFEYREEKIGITQVSIIKLLKFIPNKGNKTDTVIVEDIKGSPFIFYNVENNNCYQRYYDPRLGYINITQKSDISIWKYRTYITERSRIMIEKNERTYLRDSDKIYDPIKGLYEMNFRLGRRFLYTLTLKEKT